MTRWRRRSPRAGPEACARRRPAQPHTPLSLPSHPVHADTPATTQLPPPPHAVVTALCADISAGQARRCPANIAARFHAAPDRLAAEDHHHPWCSRRPWAKATHGSIPHLILILDPGASSWILESWNPDNTGRPQVPTAFPATCGRIRWQILRSSHQGRKSIIRSYCIRPLPHHVYRFSLTSPRQT